MPEALTDLLRPTRLTSVVDIGASPVDGEPPYGKMLDMGLCSVVGFEPHSEALEVLQETKGPRETYLPYALGDGGDHTLHLCEAPGMTSLLEPDEHVLRHFNRFTQLGTVIGKETLRTRRLDTVDEIAHIDFLKMDVQGSELSILRHGRKKLSEAVAVLTEVSLIPLYKNQPLFWEVDKELREQGFVPHRFMQARQVMLAPFVLDNDPQQVLNQIVEADVMYVRNFFSPTAMTVEQWKHLALIAFYCCASPDLTLHALRSLVALGAISERVPAEYIANLRPAGSSVVSMADAPLPALR